MSGTEVLDCPVCGRQEFSHLHDIPGPRLISVVVCRYCAMVFQANPMNAAELRQYYSENEVFHFHGAGSRQETLVAARQTFLKPILTKKLKGSERMTVMDIGCGYGDFLASFDSDIWERVGLELNPQRAKYARLNFGLTIKSRPLEELSIDEKSIDLICAFGLLEHIVDPRPFLASIAEIVRDDGMIFMNVPNILDPMIAISSIFSIEHVLYFTEKTFKLLLEKAGFDIIVIKCMTLDYPDVACLARRSTRTTMLHQRPMTAQPEEVNNVLTTMDGYKKARQTLQDDLRNVLHGHGVLNNLHSTAIYGAGEHTRQLMDVIPELQSTAIFFDSDTKKHETKFFDGRVYPISKIHDLDVERIIISSKAFEDEIAAYLADQVPPEIQTIRLYAEVNDGANDAIAAPVDDGLVK